MEHMKNVKDSAKLSSVISNAMNTVESLSQASMGQLGIESVL